MDWRRIIQNYILMRIFKKKRRADDYVGNPYDAVNPSSVWFSKLLI